MLKVVLLLVAVLALLYCAYSLYRLIKTWPVKDEKNKVNPWLVRLIVSFIASVVAFLGLYQVSKKNGSQKRGGSSK